MNFSAEKRNSGLQINSLSQDERSFICININVFLDPFILVSPNKSLWVCR